MKQRNLLKILLIFFTAFSTNSFLGQGTETFANIGSSTSYGARSWTGIDGSTWTATNAREDQTVNGKAITLNDDIINTFVQSGTITGGIGNITISTQRKFSGGSSVLSVFINDVKVGTVPIETAVTTTTISNVNVGGSVIIKLWNDTGGSSSGGAERVAIDDVSWTAFAGPATPTIGFDTTISGITETNTDIITTGIPISLTNYDTPNNVTITPTVNASSTAEPADYTIDLTPVVFNANETNNIPLTIHADADLDDETIIIDFTVTSGTAALAISTHTYTITDDEVAPKPDLIISEVGDPLTANGRFVEIYNNGSTAINLSTEQIYFVKQVNGVNFSQRALTGTIEANTVMTIAPQTSFNGQYGFNPNENYGSANGNGDDGYFLYYGGNQSTGDILDAYGVLDEDGSGKTWEYENKRAVRNLPKSVTPKTVWDASEWTITSADISNMTPGALENEYRYDGNWKPRDVYTNSSATDDIVILSDVTQTGNLDVKDISIFNNVGIEVNAGNSLTINGNLTFSGTTSYLQANATVPSAGVVNSASVILKGNLTEGGSNHFTYFTETYHNNTTGTTNGWSLISSPTVGEKIDGNTGNGNFAFFNGLQQSATNYGIAVYDNTQSDPMLRWDYFSKAQIDVATGSAVINMENGKGYTVLPSATPTADQQKGKLGFKGAIVTIDVGSEIKDSSPANGGAGNAFNAIGNPYPSFLPINATANATNNLLTVNSGVLEEQTLWLWDKATTSYITVNQTTTIGTDKNNNERTSLYIAPAQGFFVQAKSMMTPSNFNFTEAMQTPQASGIFNRTENTRPEIKLSLTSNHVTKNTLIYYYDGKTTGFDNGYDSSIFGGFSSPDYAIYTELVSDNVGKNLAIQTLPTSNYQTTVIPIGINAASDKEITFTAKALNLPAGIKVFLEDRKANTFTRLDEVNTNYKVTLTETLNGIGRFYLHTRESALNVKDVALHTVSIFKTDNTTIRLTGLPQGKTTFSLYSILGKQTFTASFTTNGVKNIPLPKLGSGVYFAKVQTKAGKISKKIIVE